MVWQDAAIAIAQLTFIVALIPAIRKHSVLPLTTAALSFFAAVSMLVALGTLGLWIATAISAVKTSMWGVLALQSYRAENR